ncbi:MAG: hypothetical protein ACI8RZ_006934 [Myxococcota bacterium]|jgi:hypothetical protein
MSALTFLLLAMGCSYPEEAFLDDFDVASCDWQTDCFSYQDHATCLDAAVASRTEVSDSCTYDPKAARECVRDYESIDCPAGEPDATVPEACESVWDCD